MTDEKVEPTEEGNLGSVEDRARVAARSMERLRRVVERKIEDVEAAEGTSFNSDDVLRIMRESTKTITLALELEGKVDDARRIDRGGDGLDLASARAEIRRRLDRVLAGRGAGTLLG